jgi:hypothetical protein
LRFTLFWMLKQSLHHSLVHSLPAYWRKLLVLPLLQALHQTQVRLPDTVVLRNSIRYWPYQRTFGAKLLLRVYGQVNCLAEKAGSGLWTESKYEDAVHAHTPLSPPRYANNWTKGRGYCSLLSRCGQRIEHLYGPVVGVAKLLGKVNAREE